MPAALWKRGGGADALYRMSNLYAAIAKAFPTPEWSESPFGADELERALHGIDGVRSRVADTLAALRGLERAP